MYGQRFLLASAVIASMLASSSAFASAQPLASANFASAAANSTLSSVANDEQRALVEGERWFDFMQEALNNYNFSASLVHVQGQRVELFRWLRGSTADNESLELLRSLNGPEVQIVRRNQHVSYFHSMATPYSLRSNSMFGPIPTALFNEFSAISASYYAVPMGGARVLERPTIHLRLLPHEQDRFGYSLWIDRESGLPLRIATVTLEGEVLEQVQVTSLEVSAEPHSDLEQILELNPPPVVTDNQARAQLVHNWQINSLPAGFTQIRANHHRLPITGIAADYYLYTDGITRVSVYVTEDPRTNTNLRYDGLESLYTHAYRDYSVTVVGRLPMATLQRIAMSVRR
ncbi:MucB/RseB C-terminal domain-containing protein [Aliidiomarina sp.]|uniref:MucB/RseB C-terminal domain-containing protein n=1 Tax=Aliidiomarina sp. TaxID=1872439 RepID=UPI003A4DFF3F